MSTAQPGLGAWATQLKVTARSARYALGAVLAPAGGTVGTWRNGVLPSTAIGGQIVDLQVAPDFPTPSMTVQLYPGQCVISRAGQGPYVCTLDQTGRVTLDNADPANPRIDVIVARIADDRIGDKATAMTFEPVTGKPSATPSVPSLPDGCLPLAQVTVAPNSTQITGSAIVDVRRSAGIRTGIGLLLPADQASDPGAHNGQVRYRAGVLEGWDGNAWRATHRLDPFDTSAVTALTGQTGIGAIATPPISDPGWPYRLMVNGSAELNAASCRADLYITVDAPTNPPVAIGVGPTNTGSWVSTQHRVTGVLTGAHTLYLVANRLYPTGNPATWLSTPYNGSLTAVRTPA